MAKVGIVMGSDSDMPVMAKAADILEELGISYEMTIISAHREPDVFFEYAKSAEDKGFKVIIAGAGMAAHLPTSRLPKSAMPTAPTKNPVLGVFASSIRRAHSSLLMVPWFTRRIAYTAPTGTPHSQPSSSAAAPCLVRPNKDRKGRASTRPSQAPLPVLKSSSESTKKGSREGKSILPNKIRPFLIPLAAYSAFLSVKSSKKIKKTASAAWRHRLFTRKV